MSGPNAGLLEGIHSNALETEDLAAVLGARARKRGLRPPERQDCQLRVTRHDIGFTTLAPGLVDIRIRVHNDGDMPSKPTRAVLRSAPLGAFLPWTPLTEVPVPAIPAGGEHTLEVMAGYRTDRPVEADPLGELGQQMDPRAGARMKVLARALKDLDRDAGFASPARPLDSTLPGNYILMLRPFRNLMPQLVASSVDGLEGREHWIGNVDVHVSGARAEKHCAAGRCAHPGVLNRAQLYVGDGKEDGYLFKTSVTAPSGLSASLSAWNVKLERRSGEAISEAISERFSFDVAKLHFTPPADLTTGKIEVAVTRESSGKTAVVEFELAAG